MKLIASRPVGVTSALALYKMAPPPACASANGAAGEQQEPESPSNAQPGRRQNRSRSLTGWHCTQRPTAKFFETVEHRVLVFSSFSRTGASNLRPLRT